MKMRLFSAVLLIISMVLSVAGEAAAQPGSASVTTAQAGVLLAGPTSNAYLPLILRSFTHYKVGMVTSLGGVDDRSFNSLAWKGITDAIAQFSVLGKYLVSNQPSDYATNIQRLLDEKQDLIVPVGFQLGIDTAKAAKANPTARFAIVDFTYPDCWPGAVEGVNCGSFTTLPNVRSLAFQVDQAAFLAGYLAAGMTETGIVGTYGGMQIPTVTIFMKGYEAGVKYYNQQNGTNVQLLGWNETTHTGLFTGDFGSFSAGVTFATNLVASGADILFPVAGSTGFGTASYCKSSGSCLVIGVDTDWFVTVPEYASVELSSVLKKVDVAVYKTIEDLVKGQFSAGTRTYNLADSGVDLAPFHNFDSLVPQSLKDDLATIKAALISGALSVDGVLFKKVGLVTDLGGVNDNSFNAMAWKGATDAITNLNVSGGYLESSQQSDFAVNVQKLLDAKDDLIVPVGFLMGIDTAKAARANPGARFAIVDYTYPDCQPGEVQGVNCGSFTEMPNVRSLAFQIDQAAFLAGYLAAGMTETGKVGTYGGMQLPTVTISMKGYQAGVKYYNKQHLTSVQEIGWTNATQTGLFTGTFNSFDAGVTFATNLVASGADILFPVAGPTGLGSASYCKSSGKCLIIGVDTDWFITYPEYASVELTSVRKRVDVVVYRAIQDVVNGVFTGGTHFYNLSERGVDLAPFHNFDSLVPPAFKVELGEVKGALIDGIITVDGVLSE